MLVGGAVLLLGLPEMLVCAGNGTAIFDPRIHLLYALPVIVGTTFLYDYHPKRRVLFFWGGAVVMVASLLMLLKGQ